MGAESPEQAVQPEVPNHNANAGRTQPNKRSAHTFHAGRTLLKAKTSPASVAAAKAMQSPWLIHRNHLGEEITPGRSDG